MLDTTVFASAGLREVVASFRDYRAAWRLGITAFRKLCHGTAPTDLGEVLTFLCVSRSISDSLGFYRGFDYTPRFLEDLNRWQLIFSSQSDRHLDLFKEAVSLIWSADLDSMSHVAGNTVKEEIQYFHGLACCIVDQAGELLRRGPSGGNSLEWSQRRWRERTGWHSTTERTGWHSMTESDATAEIDNPNSSRPGENQYEPAPPELSATHQIQQCPLRQEISQGRQLATVQPLVSFLMAGTIFCIVLMFLSRKFDAEPYKASINAPC